MNTKILIADNEKHLSDYVTTFLRDYGFQIHQSFDGQAAIEEFVIFNPDIILLDYKLPDISGILLCKKLRKHKNVGVIFLTSLSDKANILQAFKSGADDYIIKPFDMDILLSRIRALSRRIKQQTAILSSEKIQIINNIEFHIHNSNVMYNGNYAKLTPIEFKILYYLSCKKDYCAKNEIYELLYGRNSCDVESRTISVHMSNIRKKLREIYLDHIVIKSKYNKGYRLEIVENNLDIVN